MKKLLIISIVFIMLLSLTACGSGNGSIEDTPFAKFKDCRTPNDVQMIMGYDKNYKMFGYNWKLEACIGSSQTLLIECELKDNVNTNNRKKLVESIIKQFDKAFGKADKTYYEANGGGWIEWFDNDGFNYGMYKWNDTIKVTLVYPK